MNEPYYYYYIIEFLGKVAWCVFVLSSAKSKKTIAHLEIMKR